MNEVGRNRSQATHEAIRVADHSDVFGVTESDRGASAGQGSAAIWNIGRRELPGSVSRAESCRVYREMRRLVARARGDRLLGATARGRTLRPARETIVPAPRMR